MLDDKAIDKIYKIICKRIGCKRLKFFHFTPHTLYAEILTSVFDDGRCLYVGYGLRGRVICLQEKIDDKIEENEMRRLIVETILEKNKEYNIYTVNEKLILKAGMNVEELLIEGDLEDD